MSIYKLGEITKSISQGIVTGFNDIYLITDEIINANGLETTYLQPAYKGRDIRNGKLIDTGTYVFYPYIIDCNGKTVAISEEQLKTDTPMMYNYLFQKKEELGKRDYFNKSSKLWYELWNPRKKEHFLAKKFVFAEINMFNDFALVEECFYTDSACGAELIETYSKYYTYLLLFLNSDVATYIYKKISVPKANGYSIYKNAFLKEMPIILEDEAQLEKFDDMTQGEFNSYLRDILQISDDENSLIETTLEAYREG